MIELGVKFFDRYAIDIPQKIIMKTDPINDVDFLLTSINLVLTGMANVGTHAQ